MLLFLIFVLVPIIEIALFIQVGGALGLWPTLAIVVLTALAGSVLLRAQGLSTLGRLRGNLETLQDPSRELAHGALILVAGVVLLTPGFFTDAVGLLLMAPPVRDAVIKYASSRINFQSNIHVHSQTPREEHPYHPDEIFDVEYEDVSDKPSNGPKSGWTKKPD